MVLSSFFAQDSFSRRSHGMCKYVPAMPKLLATAWKSFSVRQMVNRCLLEETKPPKEVYRIKFRHPYS